MRAREARERASVLSFTHPSPLRSLKISHGFTFARLSFEKIECIEGPKRSEDLGSGIDWCRLTSRLD